MQANAKSSGCERNSVKFRSSNSVTKSRGVSRGTLGSKESSHKAVLILLLEAIYAYLGRREIDHVIVVTAGQDEVSPVCCVETLEAL